MKFWYQQGFLVCLSAFVTNVVFLLSGIITPNMAWAIEVAITATACLVFGVLRFKTK